MSSPLPYGSWPSPIAPQLMAASEVGLAEVRFDGQDVLWNELRPTESGRNCIVRRRQDGAVADALPAEVNARTLVHEYGGGSWTATEGSLIWASFADQRLYRLDPGGEPRPITPAPASERAVRWADLEVTPDGGWLYCVRERHAEGAEAVNDLVVLSPAPPDADQPVTVVADGHNFFSFPRVSPDGTRLAWTSWDHPRMPWDGAELWVGRIAADGSVDDVRLVAGGPGESIFQPAWSPDGTLHFVSDRSGWWNLYRELDGRSESVVAVEAELGAPQWVFGLSTYAFLDDGRIACIVSQGGLERLAIVKGGSVEPLEVPWTAFPGPYLASDGRRVATIAGSFAEPAAVVVLEPEALAGEGDPLDWVRVLRRSLVLDVDPGLVPAAEPIEFETAGGERAHALYYPPTNPDAAGPDGERPPLLVNSHGGPTAQTLAMFSLSTAFWTSRGFGVVHVNYGGSTGYGRAYRERLNGRWGIVDVDDCVAAAQHLARRGSVDPARLAIRGGSAGGYTTLCALAFRDDFAAGTSYFGVADAAALAAETHKFESRYLDGLIGPWPEAAETYRERSPIHHTAGLDCPLLLLQGLEDQIVPPSQAEQMAEALAAKGVPFAYLPFEGEQHGFRQVANIQRAFEAELAFYGQVFGFTPADELPPFELTRPQPV